MQLDDTITFSNSQTNIPGPIPNVLATRITASGNISSSGNVFGDRLVAASYVDTPQLNSSVLVNGNVTTTQITASSHISSSGDITSNKLTVASTVIFPNLPTSDPGIAGHLYRDGGTVKVSI